MIKRYFITVAVLLVLGSLVSMWRENCSGGCEFLGVAFGWPVFLRTPAAPETSARPEFFLVPLLVNIGWSGLGSLILWTMFETFSRWQDRKPPPEVPGI